MSTRYPCGNATSTTADAVLVVGARTRARSAPRLDEAEPSAAATPPELGDATVAIIEFAQEEGKMRRERLAPA